MNYIVNPMWFYLIDVLSVLDVLSFVFFIVSMAAYMLCAFVGFGIKASNEGFGEDDEDYKVGCMYLKISKKLLLLVIVFFLLTVFIPEKKTLIEMFVAKIATIENCELTLDGIKSVVDYIVIKMTEIK